MSEKDAVSQIKTDSGSVKVVSESGHNGDLSPRLDNYGSDENNPYFVRDLTYTKEEEAKVIRILDIRLFTWILLTTFVLNMDRTNNSNAISDNLPEDLGFNIDVVNTATAINAVLFSVFCVSGAIVAKIAGPARCRRAHSHHWIRVVTVVF
ncbi:hypothetical protein DFH11DRAFT_1543678 [Phellopilus nigrolimitatus]|nr:hypothetical protein DFH11DRAFT_1543678 [Phellopilus nigrolimitatus]